MFNYFAKFLLIATSMSPIFGAIAVSQIANKKTCEFWIPWIVVAVLLALLCWLLMVYVSKNAQKISLDVEGFEKNDKEVLAFLVTYLLPFITGNKFSFDGQWQVGVYVLLIIFLVVSHADAFHFNPVMGLMGYHFYGIKSNNGISQLLISRSEISRKEETINTVQIAHNVYLHINDE